MAFSGWIYGIFKVDLWHFEGGFMAFLGWIHGIFRVNLLHFFLPNL